MNRQYHQLLEDTVFREILAAGRIVVFREKTEVTEREEGTI